MSPGCCWGGRAWAIEAASEDLREFCDDCPSSLSSGGGWSEKIDFHYNNFGLNKKIAFALKKIVEQTFRTVKPTFQKHFLVGYVYN